MLRNVELSVARGECVVIVGMSGSGKSVLLENIVGFITPDAGEVRLLGQPREPLSLGTPREGDHPHIGMVFQGGALLDGLTALQNVTLPLTARGIDRVRAEARARPLLSSVGLQESSFERLPSELSGGMQKRVGIARALISGPLILLYDEPTTGLDASSSLTISRLIRKVQDRDPRLASLVITHDYLSAGLIADRVLFLDRALGGLREILSRDEIAAIRERHAAHPERGFALIRLRLERAFDELPEVAPERPTAASEPGWIEVFGRQFSGGLRTVGAVTSLLGRVGAPFRNPQFWTRLRESGWRSAPVAAAAGAFFGMLLAVQIALGLQGSGILDPLPRIVGAALIDKVGPLVVGLLMAGRISASVSAEIGGRRLTRQFDACRAMGVSPEAYWLSPTFWSCVVSLPLLLCLLQATALLGTYGVAVFRYGVKGSLFLSTVMADVTLWQMEFSIVRTALFGGVVALVGYAKGSTEKRSSEEVGAATTEAVVVASLSVIVVDFVLTFVASF